MAKQLRQKFEQLRFKQQLLSDSWHEMGNNELLNLFVDILPKTMDVEACSIFIYDPVADNVWLKAATNLPEKQIEVPRSGSFVGDVIATGNCKMAMDLDKRTGVHSQVDAKTGFVTRSMLSVPVRSVTDDKVTGAITLLNKTDGMVFDEADKVLLERVAKHLELVIQNIFIGQEMTSISTDMSRKLGVVDVSSKLWLGLTSVVIIIVLSIIFYYNVVFQVGAIIR